MSTRLSSDVTQPTAITPGDAPADTTFPEEIASSVTADVDAAKADGHLTVNTVVKVGEYTEPTYPNPRLETYTVWGPEGPVTVTRNLETGLSAEGTEPPGEGDGGGGEPVPVTPGDVVAVVRDLFGDSDPTPLDGREPAPLTNRVFPVWDALVGQWQTGASATQGLDGAGNPYNTAILRGPAPDVTKYARLDVTLRLGSANSWAAVGFASDNGGVLFGLDYNFNTSAGSNYNVTMAYGNTMSNPFNITNSGVAVATSGSVKVVVLTVLIDVTSGQYSMQMDGIEKLSGQDSHLAVGVSAVEPMLAVGVSGFSNPDFTELVLSVA